MTGMAQIGSYILPAFFQLLLLLSLSGNSAFAQQQGTQDIDTTTSSLNKQDGQGRRQGTWFIRSEALRGEPAYVTFGDYLDNKKQGAWYRLNAEGQLESVLNYQAGLLHGTSKFYEDGRLVTVGNFRSLDTSKKFDSVWVTDPITLLEIQVIVPTESGTVRHGMWRYYDAHSGQLIREEQYQIDELIARNDFTHESNRDSTMAPARRLPHQKKQGSKRNENVPQRLLERRF